MVVERETSHGIMVTAPLAEAVRISGTSYYGKRLAYAVTLAIVVNNYVALYGYRVKANGVSFGREVPIVRLRTLA